MELHQQQNETGDGHEARKSYQSLVELGRQQLSFRGTNSTLGGSNTTPPPVQMIDQNCEDDVSSFEGSFYGAGASRSNRSFAKERSKGGNRNSSKRRDSGVDPGGQHYSTSRSSGEKPRDRLGNSGHSRRVDHSGLVSGEDSRRRRNSDRASSTKDLDRTATSSRSKRGHDVTRGSSSRNMNRNRGNSRDRKSSRSVGREADGRHGNNTRSRSKKSTTGRKTEEP